MAAKSVFVTEYFPPEGTDVFDRGKGGRGVSFKMSLNFSCKSCMVGVWAVV